MRFRAASFFFLIKDFELYELQNCFNLSWSLFEIPVSILGILHINIPHPGKMFARFSYNSL